jgi:Zn-dependent protease
MTNIINIIGIAIVILISLSFHELAHAFVSYKLGDPTAKNAGRLTLNPAKHLDPLGTIMMVASMLAGAGFGWAKPVPINPYYYKNRKRGTMLVSIAGPLSNLLLSFIFSIPMIYLLLKYNLNGLGLLDYRVIIFTLCQLFFFTNINLAIFNLLPVPPLDGSKVLGGILPNKYYYKLLQNERYIGIAFIVIVVLFPEKLGAVLSTIRYPVVNALLTIAQPIVEFFI